MKDNGVLACFGILFVVVASLIGGTIMSGWVLSILWAWFVIPIFHVQALSIPAAIGLTLVTNVIVPHSTKDNKDKDTETVAVEMISTAFITPLLVLLLGWIIMGFIR